MFDNNLKPLGATITVTTTSTTQTINETPHSGLSLVVAVASQAQYTTLDVTVRESTDDSTYTLLATMEQLNQTTVSAVSTPVTGRLRFSARAKYVKVVFTTGGTGSPSFPIICYIGQRDFPNNYTVTAATNQNQWT